MLVLFIFVGALIMYIKNTKKLMKNSTKINAIKNRQSEIE